MQWLARLPSNEKVQGSNIGQSWQYIQAIITFDLKENACPIANIHKNNWFEHYWLFKGHIYIRM